MGQQSRTHAVNVLLAASYLIVRVLHSFELDALAAVKLFVETKN
jgi:hypothetical protein